MATADGSDDILSNKDSDLYCEPCLNDGQRRNVECFCMDCNEYMCQLCLDVHRKLRVLKTHRVKRGEEIPMEKPQKQVQYPPEINCHFHTDKKITSFCISHQQLCCDQCVILGHKICTDVKSIGEYSKYFKDSNDFKTAFEKLKSKQSAYKEKLKEAKMNIEEVDVYYHNAMDMFKVEVDSIKIADIAKLKAIVTSYECVLSKLAAWFEDIEIHTNNNHGKQLVNLIFGTKRELDAIDDNVQKLCSDDSIVRYGFIPDKTSLLRLLKAPFLVQTISIKQESDAKGCQIADIALLKENLILVTDYNNSSLKTFNTKTFKLVSYVKLQSGPWQMSITDQGEAYVALYNKPKILHFKSPATDLFTFREIEVDGQCKAVECFNKTLKVQCSSPANTIEVDKDGKLVRVINNDWSKETTENGKQFASNTRWSTKDPATESMYVSCITNHSITELTSDGEVKLVLQSDKLNKPWGLCMDTDGSILVCSNGSKDVFRVKRNGDIRSVLPQRLDFTPWSVALDKRTKRLFVAGASDKLCVFQI